jgi:enoyl-CoA hydratase/carnithine racemase
VLRQTEQLDIRAGLAAEAAAYSMLLAGREFRAWLQTRGAPRELPGTDGPEVVLDRHGDLLTIVLNRPVRRNAVNASVRDQLVEALSIAIASPALRVELSGRGPNFSSGGDLDEFGSAEGVDSAFLIRLERHPGWLLHRLGERAVVQVHGGCIGAGIEIPSLAHRVIATEDAYFALPEVAMGVIPGAGGTVGIPRRIGRWRTAWLALTGARIDAATGRDWGLVDDVVSS